MDLAIDNAVREMLAIEPPAGVRYRVLERIANGRPVASAFRRNVFWIGAPVTAAAALILALLLPRSTGRLEAPVAVTTSALATTPAVAPPVTSEPGGVPGRPTEPRNLVARPGRSVDHTVAAATFEAPQPVGTAIAPLARIDPIEVAALAESPIAPAAIAVRPLNTITEVQVAPLTPPDRRN